jgi:hypothetical protein
MQAGTAENRVTCNNGRQECGKKRAVAGSCREAVGRVSPVRRGPVQDIHLICKNSVFYCSAKAIKKAKLFHFFEPSDNPGAALPQFRLPETAAL